MSIELFNIYRKYRPSKSKPIKLQYNVIPELIPHNELELNSGDILAFHFDPEQFDVDEVPKMFGSCQKAFPNVNMMALIGNTNLDVIRAAAKET